MPNFDIKEFIKERWYVHQQAPTKYVPVDRNFCSYAEYSSIIDGKPTFPWGYTVKVNNHAEDSEGNTYGGELCAYQQKDTPSKLGVAPCKVPKFLSGPYWVLAYDENDGYALISGGQPTVRVEGGCRTGNGVFESGLWIFLRSRERNEDIIAEVRALAKDKFGLDISVLNDVDQTNCKDSTPTVENKIEKSS